MTSKQPLHISRRSVLAGLGAVGIASAGTGLGTTAFFSDREDFTDNALVAGELDLKVDWQQFYYGPETNGYGSAGRPYVNAYPDANGDGQQDPVSTRDELAQARYGLDFDGLDAGQAAVVEADFRAQFADAPDDLDGPLVRLDDVKPGDSGCVAFSLHLFDNPGYLWFCADNYENRENSVNEPESKDPDEDDTAELNATEYAASLDGPDVYGELGDRLIVTVWYDDDADCELDAGETVVFGPGVGSYTGPDGDNPATLSAAIAELGEETGCVPLVGDGASDFTVDPVGRACFPNSTTAYLTFAWELPVDHANEIQSDSVAFDLSFYAEQCRHNDGSGSFGEGGAGTDVGTGTDPAPEPSITGASLVATPDTAGNDASVHRLELPISAALDGQPLTTVTLDYPDGVGFDLTAPATSTADVLTAGLVRGTTFLDATVDGSSGADATQLTLSLSGLSLAAGDVLVLEYVDVGNADTADDYVVAVAVEGDGETVPVSITPDTGSNTAGLPVVSDFEDGTTQGFLAVGDISGVPYVASESGNEFLEAVDSVSGGLMYWDFPGKYLGDKSAAYGGTLSFRLQQTDIGTPNQVLDDDVIIEGGGQTLTLRFDTYPDTASFTSYTVTLDETEDWEEAGVDQSYVQTVLSNLTSIRVRAEYENGDDTDRIDDVVMVGP